MLYVCTITIRTSMQHANAMLKKSLTHSKQAPQIMANLPKRSVQCAMLKACDARADMDPL